MKNIFVLLFLLVSLSSFSQERYKILDYIKGYPFELTRNDNVRKMSIRTEVSNEEDKQNRLINNDSISVYYSIKGRVDSICHFRIDQDRHYQEIVEYKIDTLGRILVRTQHKRRLNNKRFSSRVDKYFTYDNKNCEHPTKRIEVIQFPKGDKANHSEFILDENCKIKEEHIMKNDTVVRNTKFDYIYDSKDRLIETISQSSRNNYKKYSRIVDYRYSKDTLIKTIKGSKYINGITKYYKTDTMDLEIVYEYHRSTLMNWTTGGDSKEINRLSKLKILKTYEDRTIDIYYSYFFSDKPGYVKTLTNYGESGSYKYEDLISQSCPEIEYDFNFKTKMDTFGRLSERTKYIDGLESFKLIFNYVLYSE